MTHDDADDASPSGAPAGRRPGRPRKNAPPAFPVDEVDKLLVFGEPAKHEATGLPVTRFPSIRELAKRFDVSHNVIAMYAARHNCMKRREEIEQRTRSTAEKKLVALRADQLAVSTDDAIAIIDEFVLGFAEALKAGRVRCDNPADLNTALRLKAFLLGGADQRQELLGAVSLEHLQTLHKDYLKQETAESRAARGEAAPKGTSAPLGATAESGTVVKLANDAG